MNDWLADVNVEDISGRVLWNVKKARCILTDLMEYFCIGNNKAAFDDALHEIRLNYDAIFAKLHIVEDMLNNINETVQPIEEAAERHSRKF